MKQLIPLINDVSIYDSLVTIHLALFCDCTAQFFVKTVWKPQCLFSRFADIQC